jgi:hypothetical protein
MVRDGELDRVNAELAVAQAGAVRPVLGTGAVRDTQPGWRRESGPGWGEANSGKQGPGARAGRRDYSQLPRVEVI